MSAAYLKGPAVRRIVCVIPPACSGKEPFATPGLAVMVLRRNPLAYVGRSHYRCRVCGKWHITGSPHLLPGRKATEAMALVRAE